MIRIAIVEDDPRTAATLLGYMEQAGQKAGSVYAAETFSCAEDFLVQPEGKFQLVFFDIGLPGMNGMEAAKSLRERDKHMGIVFITNMAQYAVKGYEVRAIDYILKPLRYPDFESKLQRAVRWVATQGSEMVILETAEGMVRCPVCELFCVHGERHLITYITERGACIRRGFSIKNAEKQLSRYGFVRVSGNYLVNLRCIRHIGEDHLVAGHTTIPISKAKREELIRTMAAYFGSQEE